LGTASLTKEALGTEDRKEFNLTRPILLQRIKVWHPVVNSATE